MERRERLVGMLAAVVNRQQPARLRFVAGLFDDFANDALAGRLARIGPAPGKRAMRRPKWTFAALSFATAKYC